MANSVDPDQTAPIGATLFASILNLSVMLGSYLQQTTSADENWLDFLFQTFCLPSSVDVVRWIDSRGGALAGAKKHLF